MTATASRQGVDALIPGIAAGLIVGLTTRPLLGVLAGYDAAALFYVTRVWLNVWPLDADQTAEIAVGEDPLRAAADLVLLVAAVASLGAIVAAIVTGHDTHGGEHNAGIALGGGSVVVSWLLVHTIFALKYARLYYGGPGEGGVKFDGDLRPPYSDFAYLAFTIGMTFQVSDTDFQTSEFRRLALRHALMSYLFGAVILGASINLIAGLAT